MKVFQAAAIAALVVVCHCLIGGSHAAAQENERPSPVTNPHHIIELAPFVQSPSVRRELKLTDVQILDVETIEAAQKESFEDYKKQVFHLVDGSSEERRAAFLRHRGEVALLRQHSDSLFTAEQLNRLKQLASQHVTADAIRGFGLLDIKMKEELAITDEQAKTLHEKSAGMAEQLQRREAELKLALEKLRTQLRAEVVESLDPEQRAKLKALWGDLVPLPQ